MSESQMVTIVNHGNAFGSGNWYTFYCPECGAQVSNRQDSCKCGQELQWKPIKPAITERSDA